MAAYLDITNLPMYSTDIVGGRVCIEIFLSESTWSYAHQASCEAIWVIPVAFAEFSQTPRS